MPVGALEIDRLSRRYGDLVALRDASFQVGAGELFGFVGSNGAGKTTAVLRLGAWVKLRDALGRRA